jgi:CXXX repeat modification system protein
MEYIMDTCKVCGKEHLLGERKNLNIIVTEEELNDIKLIKSKSDCVDQAFNLVNVPSDASQETIDKFTNSIINKKSEVLFLENNWWGKTLAKYNLTGSIFLDFSDGSLYKHGEQ